VPEFPISIVVQRGKFPVLKCSEDFRKANPLILLGTEDFLRKLPLLFPVNPCKSPVLGGAEDHYEVTSAWEFGPPGRSL